MEDFPIWLKAIIYVTIAATVIYTVGELIYHAFFKQ
jgi:hypothetical protein